MTVVTSSSSPNICIITNYSFFILFYRLSRARRIIENAFGILVARWRIFKTEIACKPRNAKIFTKAAVVLHNYCMTFSRNLYCPSAFADHIDGHGRIVSEGQWRKSPGTCMAPIDAIHGHRFTMSAVSVRDEFADYFTREDVLSWQSSWVNYDGRQNEPAFPDSESDSDSIESD